MTYWDAILLGIIQGATEFLPVSSDGHLLIAQWLIGLQEGGVAVTVMLHAGTLLSILVAFRRDILMSLRQPRLIAAGVVATLPVVPVGLFAKHLIDETLNTPVAAAIGLIITATFLFVAASLKEGVRPLEQVRLRDALVIGLFQALAPAPGVSRSGSTILAGLLCGLTRDAAARFAFLIAIPAISGALVLYTKEILETGPTSIAWGPLLVGGIVAFFVGLIAIQVLLAVVIRRQLRGFAWYCLLLGISVLCGAGMQQLTSPETQPTNVSSGESQGPPFTRTARPAPAAVARVD